MRLRPYILAIVFCLASGFVAAQDAHFTLHDYNPLWLNPAQTGAFSGTVRVGGIYRGQWYTLNDINTPSAYVDAPVIRGLRKYDWIGVGANLISDKAGAGGDLGLKSTYFGFSAAYHLALDNNRRNVVTLGAQYGSTNYSLDLQEASLNQQLTIGTNLGGGGQPQGELRIDDMEGGDGESYSDVNAGLMLRSVLDPKKNNTLEVGISAFHLNGPKRTSLYPRDSTSAGIDSTTLGTRAGDDERRRRPTFHAHARLDLEMSEKWRFQPSIFAQSSGSVTSVSLQAWGSRALKEDLDLRLGLGYRTGDAAQILIGMDYDRIKAALSYDITLSQGRTVTNYQGGFELSAQYIINIYKKPVVVPTMLCPKI